MNQLVRAAMLGLGVILSLAAQQVTLGTASTSPGQSVTLSVLLASQGAQISALQFDLIYNNAGLSILPQVAAGASATAAGKGIATNALSASDLRVIVSGFNQTPISDGAVAILTIQASANAAAGTYPITFANVNATDPHANAIALVATNGSVTVTGSVGPLTIVAPGSLPAATVSAAYSQTVTAAGGAAPYKWSATGLPNGLTIAQSTGIISGTPTSTAGSPFNVQVTVTDSKSASANKSYNLTVNAALAISAPALLPPGILGATYPATTAMATGGAAPYSWSATGLPNGLTIGAVTGVIGGTPTATAGSPYNVQVTVTDSNSVTTTRGYSLTVTGPLSITGPASLPAATVNAAYSATVTAAGGSGIYTWSATGLPGGLSMAANTGIISGTPTTATGSPFSVQVTVTDSNSVTAKIGYALTISPQSGGTSLTISGPSTLPAGTVNAAYPATALSAQGGSGTYTWSATGLPPGLSIGATTGAITGTPTTNSGSPYAVLATVTDSTGTKATRSYTLSVNVTTSGSLTISGPASLPVGTVNVAYASTTIAATGGSGTYTWSATGLPLGLSMGVTTGTIGGTPATSTGSPFHVQVTVTDSASATAIRSYSLTVNLPPVTLPSIAAVSNAAAGQSVLAPNTWLSIYGSNFTSLGFTDDWSKSIVNGELPTVLDGVSVTAGGQAAYISYLSPTQINVLLPQVGFGQLQLTVMTPAGTSAPVTIGTQPYSPAFFSWPNNQPVATHADYTVAAKNGSFQGTPTVPAKPGEVIILWGTGFGPTNPTSPDGAVVPATQTYYTATPVTVTVGSLAASVYGAALASSYAGLYQLVITIPASLPAGDYTVVAGIGGVQTPAATLTVQN